MRSRSSIGKLGGAGMGGEQCRQPRRIAARHAAFGGDAVDADVTARRVKPRFVALGVVVVDEAEIERGAQPQLELLERREISVVGAALRHRQMEELDWP